MSMSSLNPEAYRFDSAMLHTTLIKEAMTLRTVASNNIGTNLDYDLDDKYRYYEVKDDSNPQLTTSTEGQIRRADFSLEYTDENVYRIAEALAYSRATLRKINNSRLPVSRRVQRLLRYYAITEERVFFAGDPKQGVAALTDASSQTAATTNFDTQNVSTMRTSLGAQIGQLIDTYKATLKNYPLFLVVSPDVYKEIIGVTNANTDRSAIGLLTEMLKEAGMETGLQSHIFMSQYLFGQTGALDLDGPDVVLETEGTEASALICGDPNAWRMEFSSIFQGSWQGPRGSMEMEIGYSILPYYHNDDAIIYDNDVELAAQ